MSREEDISFMRRRCASWINFKGESDKEKRKARGRRREKGREGKIGIQIG
jgi:hypothetical protein